VLAPSLPFVEFDVPFTLDGTHGRSFSGPGLLVDAARGLVVVDRDTVPVSLGDATLTFARSVRVPGEVVAIHPEHNLSVLRYDPRALGDTPVRSARLELAPLSAGDEIWLVGLNANQLLLARSTEVARIGERRLPIPRPPRFREANLEVVTVVDPVAVLGGALSDGRGRVRALWSAFSIDDRGKPSALMGGIPAELVAEMIAPLRRGKPFRWRSLGVELSGVSIQDARDRGLGDETVRRLEADDARHRVLEVRRITAGTPAADLLVEGDLLLLVNGAPVTSFRDVERAAQAEDVALQVLRDGAELDLRVATVDLDPIGTSRAVVWAGALLQAPPLAVRAQRASPGDGVYVIGRRHGSPADRDGLLSTRRIVAVNGTPTPDMDRFLAAVSETPDRGSVRLRVVDLDGRIEVLTLEVDLRYWPTYELARETNGWRRIAR